jgi:hypothetical protein
MSVSREKAIFLLARPCFSPCIATPFIFVLALFESEPYREAVANGYGSALRLWEKFPLP